MDPLHTLAGALRSLDPELYTRLQDEQRLTEYLYEHLLEPELLGRELLSSKSDYLSNILEEEFTETFHRFRSACILHYELINLVTLCAQTMEDYGFPANENNRLLRYEIIGMIAEYLEEGGDDGV